MNGQAGVWFRGSCQDDNPFMGEAGVAPLRISASGTRPESQPGAQAGQDANRSHWKLGRPVVGE